MSTVAAIRSRLADERGYSLMEMSVSVLLGLIVVLAGYQLLTSSSRASTDVADRVDAAARARDGMEAITARLRSQVCLNDDGPAIVRTSPTSMDFFSVHGNVVPSPVIYGNTDATQDTAQARRIEFRAGVNGAAGKIVEYQWNSPLPADDPSTRYPEAAGVFPPVGLDGQTAASVVPTRTLMTGVERPGGTGAIFKYFRFQPGAPATPDQPVAAASYRDDDGNPATNDGDELARIVRIEVSFDAVAERLSDTGPKKIVRNGSKPGTDSTFTNEAYVRTADSGQPEESPECF